MQKELPPAQFANGVRNPTINGELYYSYEAMRAYAAEKVAEALNQHEALSDGDEEQPEPPVAPRRKASEFMFDANVLSISEAKTWAVEYGRKCFEAGKHQALSDAGEELRAAGQAIIDATAFKPGYFFPENLSMVDIESLRQALARSTKAAPASQVHHNHDRILKLAGEMGRKFEVRMGHGTWTDPAYRQDASIWAAAWHAATPSAAPEGQGVPVALQSVELIRDIYGMCIVKVNGREAMRDNGDVISHCATLDWFAPQPPAGAVEKDAGRYKVLRTNNWSMGPKTLVVTYAEAIKLGHSQFSFEQLDAAIDRASTQPGGVG